MNYLLFLLGGFLLPIVSLKQSPPKLCIHCKHLIEDNRAISHSKCSVFPKIDDTYFVTGIHEKLHYYCSTARQHDDMCGKEGKHYKKKRSQSRKEKM